MEPQTESHENLSTDELPLIYYVNVLKDDLDDVFQAKYTDLDKAIRHINDKYGHWDFKDTSAAQSGCGSCSNSN